MANRMKGVYYNRVVDTLDGISLKERAALSRAIKRGEFKLPFLAERLVADWEPSPNKLVNEGEDSILDTYFRNTNVPTGWNLDLIKSSAGTDETAFAETVVKTDAIFTSNLVSGGAYAAVAFTRGTGDWTLATQKATSATKSFPTATADWGVIRFQALTTATSNKFVSIAKFAADHNLLTGYRMDAYWELTLD